jgi:hypothetical protein
MPWEIDQVRYAGAYDVDLCSGPYGALVTDLRGGLITPDNPYSWRQSAMPRVLNIRNLRHVPPGTVYIGRRTPHYRLPASKWRNPFIAGKDGTREEVIAKFRRYLCDSPDLLAALPELRGKDLVCWCAPGRCHGDVLLEMANQE